MAGCKKADRNRKSVSNAAYVSGKRQDLNRKRKIAKNEKEVALAKAKTMKVPRGTARSKRREAAASSGIKGEHFNQVWAKFKLVESGETTLGYLLKKQKEAEKAAAMKAAAEAVEQVLAQETA